MLLPLALLFVLLSSPATYRLTSRLGGAMIASAAGCPTHLGVLLHAVVFAVVFVVVAAVARRRRGRSEGFTTRIPVTGVKLIKTVPTVFSSKEMGTKTLPVGYFSVGGGRVGYRIAGHATSVLYTNQSSALYAYRHPNHRNENMTVYIPSPSPPPRQVRLSSASTSTSKPVLPVVTGRSGAGVTAEVERYYAAELLRTDKYVLDRSRVGVLVNKFGANMVAPRTPAEAQKLAFFQKHIADLLNEVQRRMPGSPIAQNLKKVYRGKVGLNSGEHQQAMIPNWDSAGRADFIMAIPPVESSQPISKLMMIIVHEIAHAAIMDPNKGGSNPLSDNNGKGTPGYDGSSVGHGPRHTAMWKTLTAIAISLGWKYIAITYPKQCERYKFCDMHTIPGARGVVFSIDKPIPGL